MKLTNVITHLVILPLSALHTVHVSAEVSTADILDALSPFPRAQVVEQRTATVEDYALALGEMKKIRDRWGPERERRLSGDLQKQTLQIPDGHSEQEAFAFYHRKMRNFNARILYECEARNCGSSNAWANEHFADKTLYGLDDRQRYGIYEIVDEQGLLNYVAIYTVARGNRRVYAHTEWLRTDNKITAAVAPSADEVTNYLRDQGYYVISALTIDGDTLSLDDEHLQALVSAIRSNRRMNFYLVGHSYQAGTLNQQQDSAKQFAQQVLDMLVESGVDGQRLSVHALGPLAPAGRTAVESGQKFRVELVVAQP